MVGVLVHVQSQDRDAAGDALLMSGGGVDDQPCVSWHVGQQDPTGTTGKSMCQGDEFVAPALHGPKIASGGGRGAAGGGIQPELPASPCAKAMNSSRQRFTDPKSRAARDVERPAAAP